MAPLSAMSRALQRLVARVAPAGRCGAGPYELQNLLGPSRRAFYAARMNCLCGLFAAAKRGNAESAADYLRAVRAVLR